MWNSLLKAAALSRVAESYGAGAVTTRMLSPVIADKKFGRFAGLVTGS